MKKLIFILLITTLYSCVDDKVMSTSKSIPNDVITELKSYTIDSTNSYLLIPSNGIIYIFLAKDKTYIGAANEDRWDAFNVLIVGIVIFIIGVSIGIIWSNS